MDGRARRCNLPRIAAPAIVPQTGSAHSLIVTALRTSVLPHRSPVLIDPGGRRGTQKRERRRSDGGFLDDGGKREDEEDDGVVVL